METIQRLFVKNKDIAELLRMDNSKKCIYLLYGRGDGDIFVAEMVLSVR